jgi:hypothetical protein
MKTILIFYFVVLLINPFLNASNTYSNNKEVIILGKWNENQLDRIIRKSSDIPDFSERITFLSKQFLNVNYQESTLIGNINTPEVFVIDLEGVDCFTYIDYLEALRLSNSYTEFKEQLKAVRYQSGNVNFVNRNHFFTDWQYSNPNHIEDITEKIGANKTKNVVKTLNKKKDGTHFLTGIPVKQRKVQFIPSYLIDDEILGKLKSGDYIGIYSDINGLDVSHVGVFVKNANKTYLRHASSSDKNRKVIDEDFMTYISNKPGIIVFRPK